jgi:hypothetical protein
LGHVRPVVSAAHQGHRFVAVGNRIYFDKNWRTFHDFLLAYGRDALGVGWGRGQLKKPIAERHEVMRWYAHIAELQKTSVKGSDGIYSMVRDGITSAYLVLIYDLYVLRNQGHLQKEVVRRLRIGDQFRGARYELFVTSPFVRAGFEIAFEDERDRTRRHPEFVARDPASGFRFAVEAKAKQRQLPTSEGRLDVPRPRVASLLADAAGKKATLPLVTFLELDLPPSVSPGPPSWVADVHRETEAVVSRLGTPCPLDLVFFTNVPHHYGQPGEPDPARALYVVRPPARTIPDLLEARLVTALRQYGNVPESFDAWHNPRRWPPRLKRGR